MPERLLIYVRKGHKIAQKALRTESCCVMVVKIAYESYCNVLPLIFDAIEALSICESANFSEFTIPPSFTAATSLHDTLSYVLMPERLLVYVRKGHKIAQKALRTESCCVMVVKIAYESYCNVLPLIFDAIEALSICESANFSEFTIPPSFTAATSLHDTLSYVLMPERLLVYVRKGHKIAQKALRTESCCVMVVKIAYESYCNVLPLIFDAIEALSICESANFSEFTIPPSFTAATSLHDTLSYVLMPERLLIYVRKGHKIAQKALRIESCCVNK